jgi:Leucine-rich repeat (LRR) protein
MKIIKKCGGLPLAVKVMGGMLSTRPRSEGEWEAVLQHRAWSVDGLPKELDNRIYLSYEDMPPQLKQCFLYCILSPKGTCIQWHHVILMWISEGFIQPQDGCSSHVDRLEELATEYYKELIMRNLIEPMKGSYITRYKCTMHDVVRSFAEYMARKESLVVQDIQVSRDSNGSHLRRMSVGPSNMVLEWAFLRKQESLRTLIINCKINFKPGDSLTSLSRLRVLSINNGGDCDRLVGSLCQLRHLRYLCLVKTNVCRLPEDIHRMKFLQHILLLYSMNLDSLPSSIVKLAHLRTLNMLGSNINVVIPKKFGGLTNLRSLYGFPVHMGMDGDGGWCSLQEIGPLFQLRRLTLHGLENVAASSLAERAKISSKEHLDYLELNWSSSGCVEPSDEIEKQQQSQAAEDILEKLCPPPCIQHIHVQGYFGRMLPNWMVASAIGDFKSLRYLTLQDLPYCSKLPDGLCRLPSLEALNIIDAPRIKRVGLEFQASSSLAVAEGVPAATLAGFPNLTNLQLEGLCEWEEWDWDEQAGDVTAGTMAMPALKGLTIQNCKLGRLPPGLADTNRHALRALYLYELKNLTTVENFPSVVELDVFGCLKLTRVNGLSRLQKIRIFDCPNMEVLYGVPSLDSLELKDATMETLPRYLRGVNPRYLKLTCSKMLYESLLTGGSSEYEKIGHVKSRAMDYVPVDED